MKPARVWLKGYNKILDVYVNQQQRDEIDKREKILDKTKPGNTERTTNEKKLTAHKSNNTNFTENRRWNRVLGKGDHFLFGNTRVAPWKFSPLRRKDIYDNCR